MGIRVIVYPDNLLILAESHELAKSHVTLALNLLESLEFSVNVEESVLTPTTSIEFLGFSANSLTLTLSLPRDKTEKIR